MHREEKRESFGRMLVRLSTCERESGGRPPQRRDRAMANRALNGIGLLMLGVALTNCDRNPTQPSPKTLPVTLPAAPTPAPVSVFADATLSGLVYEVVTASPRQIVGIPGVAVYCEPCGESSHNWAYT